MTHKTNVEEKTKILLENKIFQPLLWPSSVINDYQYFGFHVQLLIVLSFTLD